MSDWSDVSGSFNVARAMLRGMTQMSKESSRVLETKLITRSDDDELVVATANGLGELIQLSIAERSLYYSDLIGSRITLAVTRARAAGREFGKRFEDMRYPALASLRSLGESVFDASVYEGFEMIDYPDSEDTRNTIAECAELLRSIAYSAESFKGRFVRSEVRPGLGFVEINIADTELTVGLHAYSLQIIKNVRLAERVVEAFRNSQLKAQTYRLYSLQDFSLWLRRQRLNTSSSKGDYV